jgi:hypothetical protein
MKAATCTSDLPLYAAMRLAHSLKDKKQQGHEKERGAATQKLNKTSEGFRLTSKDHTISRRNMSSHRQ